MSNHSTLQSRGKLIVFEGGEGAGKSSHIATVCAQIERAGHRVISTREPGGTELGERLRAILLDPAIDNLHPRSEMMLMMSARVQHIETVIEPALRSGVWVVCDRFADSTVAYQGAGRELGINHVVGLQNDVLQGYCADATLLFDVDVEVGLERARKRAELDRFEQEKLGFFKRVKQAYLDVAALAPERYHLIDANVSMAEVEHRVQQCIDDVLCASA